jgi:Ca2+-binding EF-hand superfamily protein
MMDDILLF